MNITAWLCGWVETQDIIGLLSWSMLCGTSCRHIILWTRKEMTGQHQQGNLLCKGTSCTMAGTLMASLPNGLNYKADSSSCVQGTDFMYTVNTLMDNTGHTGILLSA